MSLQDSLEILLSLGGKEMIKRSSHYPAVLIYYGCEYVIFSKLDYVVLSTLQIRVPRTLPSSRIFSPIGWGKPSRCFSLLGLELKLTQVLVQGAPTLKLYRDFIVLKQVCFYTIVMGDLSKATFGEYNGLVSCRVSKENTKQCTYTAFYGILSPL